MTLKLSVKGDYATRAVLSLARRYGRGDVCRMEDLAQESRVPSNYLVQILLELKSANIVRSVRGKAGGYQLARPPSDIAFLEVLRCAHGALLESPAMTDDSCPAPLRDAWRRLQRVVENEASEINFQQLLEANLDPERMFYI